MAEEEGTPAPLTAAGLEGLTAFELEKEYARLGTRYHVLTPDGRELFQIERPMRQAAASEAVNLLVGSGSNSRSRYRYRDGPDLGTQMEHRMGRHYEMWAGDDRWLGRMEKIGGAARPQWTLFLSDWEPFAWIDIGSAVYGPPTGVVLDTAGNPALSFPLQPFFGSMPLFDAFGRPAGDLTRTKRGIREVIALRAFLRIHPIHFAFLAVAHDYETHPGE